MIDFGFGFSDDEDDERDSKRTLTTAEKYKLWYRADKKCEACGIDLDYPLMEAGHDKAHSKGGKTTLTNSLCLCANCNKLQRTDSLKKFRKHPYLENQGVKNIKSTLKKMEITVTKSADEQAADKKRKLKQSLDTLTIKQLKSLTEKYHVKANRSVVPDIFGSHTNAPTKKQYINKLSGKVTEKDLKSLPKETPKIAKKKKKTKSDDYWGSLLN